MISAQHDYAGIFNGGLITVYVQVSGIMID